MFGSSTTQRSMAAALWVFWADVVVAVHRGLGNRWKLVLWNQTASLITYTPPQGQELTTNEMHWAEIATKWVSRISLCEENRQDTSTTVHNDKKKKDFASDLITSSPRPHH